MSQLLKKEMIDVHISFFTSSYLIEIQPEAAIFKK
jgi:hypothetical protein